MRRQHPRPRARQVIHLQNHHIATIAAALFQQPAGSGASLLGRHDFQKCIADRKHRVVQAILADRRIGIGRAQSQHRRNIGGPRIKIGSYQRNLSQAHASLHPCAPVTPPRAPWSRPPNRVTSAPKRQGIVP